MSGYDDDYEPHVALNAAEWEDQEAYDALEAEMAREWAMLVDLRVWEAGQVATPALTLHEMAASNPDGVPF